MIVVCFSDALVMAVVEMSVVVLREVDVLEVLEEEEEDIDVLVELC